MHESIFLVQLRQWVGLGNRTGRGFDRDLVHELGERGRRRGDDHFGRLAVEHNDMVRKV